MDLEVEVAELATDFIEEEPVTSEPCLKYKAIEHGFKDIISTDSITCLAVHEKFIAVGTKWGRVHLLDHIGFPAENDIHSVHSTAVNQVCISEQGDYVASCADDGRLAIYNLSEPERNQVVPFDHVIKCIALAPDYFRTQNVVIGFSKIFLISRGLFTKTKHDELAKVNGLVTTIKWQNDFILWADQKSVCVYDIREHRPISFMQFSTQNLDLFGQSLSCHLNWCDNNLFVIGRGHSIRLCQIFERSTNKLTHTDSMSSINSSKTSFSSSSSLLLSTSPESNFGLPNRYVELIYTYDLKDCFITGISKHQNFLILLISSNSSMNNSDVLCELLVCDIGLQNIIYDHNKNLSTSYNYKEIYRENLQCKIKISNKSILGLVSVPNENSHFVYSSKNLLCVEELSIDDRIDWLLENNSYSLALQMARENHRSLHSHTIQSVGMTYIDHLLCERKFTEAAQLCQQVLGQKETWEEYVTKFLHLGQVKAITPFLPTGIEEKSIKINSSIFELVLIDYMNTDPEGFYRHLIDWCKLKIITIDEKLIQTLLGHIEHHSSLSDSIDVYSLSPDIRFLYQGLAIMYEQIGSYNEAINLLIRLRDPEVFNILNNNINKAKEHHIIDVLKENLLQFLQLDSTKGINLLIDHIDEISVDFVISRLNPDSELLFHYLDQLHSRSPHLVGTHLIELISLYIKFCREKLLSLLRSTDRYPLSEALKLCEKAKFVPETVYLLTRVGRRHDALKLIMTKGGDDLVTGETVTMEQRQAAAAAAAIAYCREEDGVRGRNFDNHTAEDDEESDENAGELWQQVVLYAVDKPTFICALLQHAGLEGLDLRLLLRKISPNMSIPGLRDSLIKLMQDYKIQLELQQSCQRILLFDRHKLLTNLMETQNRGIRFNSNGLSSINCVACSQTMFEHNSQIKQHGKELNNSNENVNENITPSKWAIFRCTHTYHENCLLTNTNKCPSCAKSRIVI